MATKGDLSRMYRNFSGSKGPQDFMSKADVDAAIAAIPAGGGKLYAHAMTFKDSNDADVMMYSISPNAEAPATLDDAITACLLPICGGSFAGNNVINIADGPGGYTLVVLGLSGSTPTLALSSADTDAVITDTVIDLSTGEPVTPDEESE